MHRKLGVLQICSNCVPQGFLYIGKGRTQQSLDHPELQISSIEFPNPTLELMEDSIIYLSLFSTY